MSNSISDLTKIAAINDDFESEIRAGNSPRIEEYLQRVDDPLRSQLFEQLLSVELAYLESDAPEFRLDALKDRFPDFLSEIDNLFESTDVQPDTDFEDQDSNQEARPFHTKRLQPSQFIGRYKLLEKLGEGGMGEVWMAEQYEPVKRKVAIKVIKSGVGSDEVIVRFEAERQALAMMEHQGIARVFDAAQTEQGMPYFVMELVHGIPITEFCNKNQLSINERLDLFTQVSHAVQHAHQKGIIHRDIKPTNILVTQYDGKPVPKLIDFGLAKATEQKINLTDKTMFTSFGQVLGTLQYMSPEQAEMNQLGVDTRTDIYSLGVLLYELLTGTTPIDQETLKQKAVLKVLASIREDDIELPSMRLSTSEQSIEGISKQRQIAPQNLHRILKGDLDWIVMKALEKERDRRYASAKDFAEDVSRFLNNDFVFARPPTVSYRVQKFVQRNKGLVVSASAIVGIVIASAIGLVLFSIALSRTNTNLTQANIDLGKANETLDTRNAELKESIEAEKAARKISERMQYVTRIRLAHTKWTVGDLLEAKVYLSLCDPQFRGWEYDFLQNKFNLYERNFVAKFQTLDYAFTRDGKWGAYAMVNNRVEFIDLESGKKFPEPDSAKQSSKIVDICFSPSGKRLATLGLNGHVAVYSIDNGNWKSELELDYPFGESIPQPYRQVTALTFAGESDVAVADRTSQVRLINTEDGSTEELFKYNELVYALTATEDGKSIAAAGKKTETGFAVIKHYDRTTGDIKLLKAHTKKINSIAYDRDGDRLISGSDDKSVRIWNLRGNLKSIVSRAHRHSVSFVAFGISQNRVVSGDIQGNVIITNPRFEGEQVRRLKGHTKAIKAGLVLQSGKVISASNDRSIRVYESGSKSSSKYPTKHRRAISDLVVLDDKHALTSGFDGSLRVYDLATGESLQNVLKAHETFDELTASYAPISMSYSPQSNTLATGSFDGVIKLWNAQDLSEPPRILYRFPAQTAATLVQHPTNYVYDVTFSKDGKYLAIAGNQNRIFVWDTSDWEKPPRKLKSNRKNHDARVFRSVEFTPDNRSVLAAGFNLGRIDLRENGVEILPIDQTGKNEIDRILLPHTNTIDCVAVSPDGRFAAAGGLGRTIRIWDLKETDPKKKSTPLHRIKSHTMQIEDLCFSNDSQQLFSAARDKTIRVWDLESGAELLTLSRKNEDGHEGPVQTLALTSQGDRIVSGGNDRKLIVWHSSRLKPAVTLDGHSDSVYTFAFHPDPKRTRLFSTSGDKTLKCWNFETTEQVYSMSTGNNDVFDLAVSPDGERLATAETGKSVSIRRTLDGSIIRKFSQHQTRVIGVDYSADGKLICSSDIDGKVFVWNESDGEILAKYNHDGKVNAVKFSSDGKRVYSGSVEVDHTVKVFEVATKKLKTLLSMPKEKAIHSIAVSSDDRFLAIGCGDGTVFLQELKKSGEPLELLGHSGRVKTVCFSPNDAYLVSAGDDKTIKIWDVHTASLKRTLVEHSDWLRCVAFSPDGKRLASGGRENFIRLLNFLPD